MLKTQKAKMATIQIKLDKLITAVEKITKRLDNFDDQFGTLNERLNQLENKLERKYVKLEENIEAELIEVTKRLKILKEFRIDSGKAALMQESYNKRMNILIHGVEENEENVWENYQQTLQKFDNFLKEALHIDPKNVEVADIHRLPQKPVIRRGVKVTRPIIVKLTNAMSKAQIFSNLNRLKTFNEARKRDGKGTVYETEHLPREFLQRKKLLLPLFKQAKANQKKTAWRVENGEYTLYVDNQKVQL